MELKKNKFVFVILTYNHSQYIIEHLESIKYQILTYGRNYEFKLLIGDDGSKDNTISLIQSWIRANKHLFPDVIILSDGINRGTCLNFTSLLPYVDSELFKVTAGDDVYSFENLFEISLELPTNDFVSGLPLTLINNKLSFPKLATMHILATSVIYKKTNFFKRISQINSINTPSLFYNLKLITGSEFKKFIENFSVTEDLPLFLFTATHRAPIAFLQTKIISVYYRRTPGSTYIIKNKQFNNDKNLAFNIMYKHEKDPLLKILIANRKWCYNRNNLFLKFALNLNYYLYAFRFFTNIRNILKEYFQLKINLNEHQVFYNYINLKAKEFLAEEHSSHST